MGKLNTVTISTDKYDYLLDCKRDLEESNSRVENLVNYIERLEKAVIDYIKRETEYGRWDFKLKGEFAEIVSIINGYEIDWSEDRPDEDETDEIEELIEEIKEEQNEPS